VIIQDDQTLKVLMLGYMNEEAWVKTNETELVTFFSRSRKTLWTKGETSGNFLTVKNIMIDCDNDTILILARPKGPVCHKGSDTCFNQVNKSNLFFLEYLQDLIDDRKLKMPEGSYTTKLFNKGVGRIAQKVGEEAVETVIEAMGDNDELFLNEGADLLYHIIVLLTQKGYGIQDVVEVLASRHK
jgi:phosphoribosyl-ATP pyrophosphohydrolase/phosphoribosyl-AMP cyclohydrolase